MQIVSEDFFINCFLNFSKISWITDMQCDCTERVCDKANVLKPFSLITVLH